MRLRARSWPWLLRHELRLAWRSLGDSSQVMLIIGGILWFLFHLPAFLMMRSVSLASLGASGMPIAGIAFWFAFTLMLSAAVIASVNALYDRGDLDLLISSPLPPSSVFIVRGLGVALSSVALFAVVTVPFAHGGILNGQFGLIAAYPVLTAIALGTTGLAFALTLFLVRALGARRARVVAQVLSALLGASLFLVLQIPNIVPDETRERIMSRATGSLGGGWIGADSPLWWPVRALFGDPLPMLATIAVGTALFVMVVRATSNAFLSGTQESAGAKTRAAAPGGETRFRRGLARNVVLKELRLILRDPNLIAKTMLQTLYLLPMLFIVARNAEFTTILAPTIIVILASMAGNLAWITIAGEEAPDLVGSAPVLRGRVRWLKALAAIVPLLALAVPFVLFYVVRSPLLALIFAVYVVLALIVAAITQVWGGKPSPQRDLKQRQKQNVLLNIVEMISTLGIAGACYLTMAGSWAALFVLPIGLLAPALARTGRQNDAA